MKTIFLRMSAIALVLTFSALSISAQVYAPFRFENNGRTVDLPTIMRETNTPDLSAAFEYDTGDTTFTVSINENPLPASTIFPIGSASSAPMIVLALQLMERGIIKLDASVNDYISSLEVPLNKGVEITVRDLLLMKPKLGSSYKPQSFSAGEKKPTLVDLARKLNPRGTRKADKGTEHGGWILLQILLEDIYGEDLQTIADREIFTPLCLEDMFYASELPANMVARAAAGHKEGGSILPGNYQRYVSTGCHGLWTTPLDYVHFVRAILDIQHGKTNSILKPETVKMAMKRAYGHRSLLFHLSTDGSPYWGGNAKGFYFNMQVDMVNNWVSVVAMNRQLNWKLGGPVLGQTFSRSKQWRSKDKLGIFLQEKDLDDSTLASIEHYAFYRGIKTERIYANHGFPAEVTATPAYVYQSSKGRAIYSGRHNAAEAIRQFIRRSQVAPKKMVADTKVDILILQRGRQRVALPVKLTPLTGNTESPELPDRLQQQIMASLQAVSGFEQRPEVILTALDRRIYLDLHPYKEADGSYAISYALFSQFDCHTPVSDNFGEPIRLSNNDGVGIRKLTSAIASDLEKMQDVSAGYVTRPVPTTVSVSDWSAIGFELSPEVDANQLTESFQAPVSVAGNYRAVLSASDPPGLYFSFPSPLDRYSGEVRELNANFYFDTQTSSVSGNVTLPVASIVTGSGSLDTYVQDDILRSSKFPIARLAFDPVALAGDWFPGITKEVSLPARLTVKGKTFSVTIIASFTPDEAGFIASTANFELDFKAIFGSPGPDGPDNIRRRLGFQAAFELRPGFLD